MKVAGYVRVSTEQQKEEGSHERQRERLEKWADRTGHDLTLYEDIAVSGQADNREAYEEMLENIDDYDMVVVRELSRFGRRLRQVINDIADLQEQDVDFKELKGEWDTSSASGELMFNIRASLNQYWADLARERALEEVQRRREAGEPIGRPKKLTEDQIDQVVEWNEDGLGYSTIATMVAEHFAWVDSIDRSTIKRYVDERKEQPAD